MPLLFTAAPALVPCPSAPPRVPSPSHRLSSLARQRPSSSPLPLTAADAPGRSLPSTAALAVPSPRELLLSRRSPFGIAVVGTAAAAAADANDDGDRIPSSGAATIIVAIKPSSPPPPPILTLPLSCLRQSAVTANCCDIAIAICSQCFVETGDTVGNPAATTTGDTITCHHAVASRREAPPGAWEAGVYLTAGAEVNHQMSPGAVRWYPRLHNDSDTVGGLVVVMTTSYQG